MTWWDDFWSAVEFLTRIPVPKYSYGPSTMARSPKFYPLAGFVIAAAAFGLYRLLLGYVNAQVRALAVLCFCILITGGLHEDALADVADSMGLGGRTRERILEIMRDSRIGSFGAIALVLSILSRFVLLSNLSVKLFWPYLASAHVLSRWSVLPLGALLPSARPGNGSGVKIAGRIPVSSFVFGTVLACGLAFAVLRFACWEPFLVTLVIVFVTAALYKRRLGGVTGDCFGATVQLVEIGIYLDGCFKS
jgi:adenosylcobinamide-GDP ribazoletransferase